MDLRDVASVRCTRRCAYDKDSRGGKKILFIMYWLPRIVAENLYAAYPPNGGFYLLGSLGVVEEPRCFGAIVDAEFIQGVFDVGLDGGFADAELRRDFAIGFAGGDQRQHFGFALGQADVAEARGRCSARTLHEEERDAVVGFGVEEADEKLRVAGFSDKGSALAALALRLVQP